MIFENIKQHFAYKKQPGFVTEDGTVYWMVCEMGKYETLEGFKKKLDEGYYPVHTNSRLMQFEELIKCIDDKKR